MRVILIPPQVSPVDFAPGTFTPTGLLSLAASVRSQTDVECQIESLPLFFPDPGALQAAARRIAALEPDAVGFSTWCHTYAPQVRLARALKAYRPDCPIIFGGPQASATDVGTLSQFPFVDYVVRGEAELTFPALVEYLRGGRKTRPDVPGLTYRYRRQVRRNDPAEPPPDLDALPVPAYDLLVDKSHAAIDIGRGCPYGCTYCSTSQFFARASRMKSVPRVIRELDGLRRTYGIRRFMFTHDCLTARRRYAVELCRALIRDLGDVVWTCMSRIDCVDDELLALMAQAGCREILYGIETGSARMQKVIGKRLDLTRAIPVIKSTVQQGLAAECSFITGFPEERPGDLDATLRLIATLRARGAATYLHSLIVEPGTAIYDQHGQNLRYTGSDILMTGLPMALEDREVVKAHPDLFSAFHYLESPVAPRRTLHGLGVLVNQLNYFRYTFKILAARRDFRNLLDAGASRIGRHLDNIRLARPGALDLSLIDWAGSYLSDQIAKRRVPAWAAEVFRMEALAYRIRNEMLRHGPPAPLRVEGHRHILCATGNWRLLECHYDLLRILDLLRAGKRPRGLRQGVRHTLAVQTESVHRVRLTKLNPAEAGAIQMLFDQPPLTVAMARLRSCWPVEQARQFIDQIVAAGLFRLEGAAP